MNHPYINTGRDRPHILRIRRDHNYGEPHQRSNIVHTLVPIRRHPHIAPAIIDDRAW